MTVVSSKEFAINEDIYFDMAVNEDVFVQRGNMMFVVARLNDHKSKKRLKPDDDLRRSISADEFKDGALKIIDKIFNKTVAQYL